MNNQKILSSAKILFKHKLNKTGLNSLKELEPQNINDAYKIQNELKVEYLSLTNNICIGKKIGCTSDVAQEQMNIKEPFYGNLFSRFSATSINKLNSKYLLFTLAGSKSPSDDILLIISLVFLLFI